MTTLEQREILPKFESLLRMGGNVEFPDFRGERHHMVKFYKNEGLPNGLKRWQNTVDQMLEGIETDSPIYIMIDQTFVPAGTPQRRPGLHVDGNWIEEIKAHGHGGRHIHRPINIPDKKKKEKTEKPVNIPVTPGKHWHKGRHANGEFYKPELIILASNISACRAFHGEFAGIPTETGDCSNVKILNGKEIIFDANRVYIGNETVLHESLPVERDCYRTLVRLNVTGVDIKTLH